MTPGKSLEFSERRDFMTFLNNGWYTLDCSSADFDAFTREIVGVAFTEKCRLSKEKSLKGYLE